MLMTIKHFKDYKKNMYVYQETDSRDLIDNRTENVKDKKNFPQFRESFYYMH